MADPEVKILRDGTARIISESKRQQAAILEMGSRLDNKDMIIAELRLENETLKRQIRYYDNPNSPPSHNSFSSQRRKKAARIDPDKHKKPGGRKGHRGVSRHKKADRTIRHTPEKCESCGSKNIRTSHIGTEYTDEIPEFPTITTTCHIINDATCTDCGCVTVPPNQGTRGTSFGARLLGLVGLLYEKKCSLSSIRDALTMFNGNYSKSTVQNAIAALGNKLEDTSNEIAVKVSNAEYIMGDETPYRIMGRQGYVWAVTGESSVMLIVAATRGSIIPDMYFPYYDKVMVCDGYRGFQDKAAVLGPHKAGCRGHIPGGPRDDAV